ncbi:hypothetical protein [Streptomyces parvulus]|uniref:hypothetical protein n=1 Tax=Streptomyces parvulus TaxID=146923 RepID=UPI0036F086E6
MTDATSLRTALLPLIALPAVAGLLPRGLREPVAPPPELASPTEDPVTPRPGA